MNSNLLCRIALTGLLLLFFSSDLFAQSSGFGAAHILGSTEATNVFDVRFADLDGDGLNDIIIVTPFQINWYKNLGDGKFGSVQKIFTHDNPGRFTDILAFDVGDVNDDGNNDIAWITEDELFVALNNGNGTFQEPFGNQVGQHHSVTINRLHDDKTHIYTGTYETVTRFLVENNQIVEQELGLNHIGNRSLSITDINNNGFNELVIVYNPEFRFMFWNEQSEEFSTSTYYLPVTESSNINYASVYMDDVNSSGFKDALVFTGVMHSTIRSTYGALSLFVNENGTTFSDPVRLDLVQLGFRSAAMLDVNQNGRIDVVAASVDGQSQKSEIYWYEQQSDGSFADAQVLVPTKNPYLKIMAVDIDSDGNTDLLAVSAKGDEVVWFKNLDGAGFGEKQIIGASDVSSPMGIISFDVDNSGLNDIIIGSENREKSLTWYKNMGDFRFDGPRIINDSARYIFNTSNYVLKHADLNQNGYQDLILYNASSVINESIEGRYLDYYLVTYPNNGDGTFGAADTIASGINYGVNGMTIGDFDGDGYHDISMRVANDLIWFRNLGNGTFSDVKVINHLGGNVIGAADVIGHGRESIISAYYSQELGIDSLGRPRIYSYNNFAFTETDSDSSETFKFHANGGFVNSIINADINNDTKPELIVTTIPIEVIFNNWRGRLAYLEKMDTESGWHWVDVDSSITGFQGAYAADINNNGNTDLISISDISMIFFRPEGHGTVKWYKNDGDGSFTSKLVDSLKVGLKLVIASDLNNDQLPEIITLRGPQELVSIYPNELNEPVSLAPLVGAEQRENLPNDIILAQNYPNPFNPTTTMSYSLPTDIHVELVVYNMLGQRVQTLVNGYNSAGVHNVIFDAGSLSSGIYFYRLTAGNTSLNKRMVLLK